jgi:hypothetical protein
LPPAPIDRLQRCWCPAGAGATPNGRLKAVRIGKQYRITREDLEAFTGYPVEPPARETARRVRHVEVSSVVQVDAISRRC